MWFILGLILLLSPTNLLSNSGFPPAIFFIAIIDLGFSHNKVSKSFYVLIELLILEDFCFKSPQWIFYPRRCGRRQALWKSLHLVEIRSSIQFIDYFGLLDYYMIVHSLGFLASSSSSSAATTTRALLISVGRLSLDHFPHAFLVTIM